MNAYITLDSKKYITLAKNWTPSLDKPSTHRPLLNGNLDSTYGSFTLDIWEGEIAVNVDEDREGWGTIANLRATLIKLEPVTFIDHYGNEYSVHIKPGKERSMTPMWDADTNKKYFDITLLADNA